MRMNKEYKAININYLNDEGMHMRIKKCKTILIPTFLLICFQHHFAFEKQANGILFEIKKQTETDAQRVKIQVCDENIIRILAAPGNSFSERPSLMVDSTNWEEVPFTVKDEGDWVEITTTKLRIRVKTKTGSVTFYDKNGQLILEEKARGGKIITPAEVIGEKTFHIQQLFNSPPEEAFYGLGAHQNGVWNYKGHDVDLWQHNIIDIIPFLISSKNYGILWDNNSRTKFGDIRDKLPEEVIRSIATYYLNRKP